MSDKKLVTTNERRQIAQLIEDDPAFLDFVLNEANNGVWMGDNLSRNMVSVLAAETEQEFFAGLCHMGFEAYTDYLMEIREHYLSSDHASCLH